MTQAPACYQDVDDVLDLRSVPNTSEDIDVNDLLDLSYVPNTAGDNVLTPQAPTPITVTPGGHTHGNTPFPLRIQDLVLEFKKGIKLDPASFAVLKDNKQWDSVHGTLKAQTACYQDNDDVLDLSYVPNTSEDIDVNDLLDLSYVPSTAEDIVLFEEKQKYMYSLVQTSCRKKSYLIDQGANGGITGIDTRVIERHSHRMVDISGIDNHEITTSIHIVTVGAIARSQPRDVILLMRQYAYCLQQGRLIHSPYQLEYLANDGNDKLIHIPGETVDCYVFPLSIRDGLPYLGMRPYTDVEYESPPHVILTSDVDWNQRLLDFDIDDADDWYDASLDNMNHSELVDAFGDYKGRTTELEVSSANTWFDNVTPDQYTRVQLEKLLLSVPNMHTVYIILTTTTSTLLSWLTMPILFIPQVQSWKMMMHIMIKICPTPNRILTMTIMLMQGAAFSRFRIQTMTTFVLCLVG
jgi:hypothetical protein